MFQTFCTPAGNECYQQMSPPASSCSTPCHGVYADVDHVQGALYPGEGTNQFQGALAEYQRFKNGGEEEVKYPAALASRWRSKRTELSFEIFLRISEEDKASLHQYLLQEPYS